MNVDLSLAELNLIAESMRDYREKRFAQRISTFRVRNKKKVAEYHELMLAERNEWTDEGRANNILDKIQKVHDDAGNYFKCVCKQNLNTLCCWTCPVHGFYTTDRMNGD